MKSEKAAEQKPRVTLIGSTIARVGLEFIYEGPLPECDGCSVKKACHNLQKGRKYRIVGVRKTRHACSVHHQDACAIEVVEAPVRALISADMAIRNTRIVFETSCTRQNCENFSLCNPEGVIPGEKYVVAEVIGSAPGACERGWKLQLVELRAA
ncbi:MAG TPA: UPF0179 family protein [Methanolinea sp.]|jgi:hypothetical protein|nr:UPF0179 family protein [Methanolinea sp.]MDI6898910.1 UPF0179 family protein [Methanolinea sp.]HOS81447.1 UPF0179 family protein [Methanolinea sp.]HPC55844.1 UPF0179 family protein [Methanolinea sp.]HQE86236.1 UPF0179 family protein [Methanolinea sp.]